MRPILIAHNVNSADIMPCVVTCAANSNDIMHGLHNTHVLVSQMYLCNYYMPEFNYWTGMQVCQLTTSKINHLTFSGTNYWKCK